MAVLLLLDHAARLTELGKISITRAIKSSWLSARRKQGRKFVDLDYRCHQCGAEVLRAVPRGRANPTAWRRA
jgi:hypothetical protein